MGQEFGSGSAEGPDWEPLDVVTVKLWVPSCRVFRKLDGAWRSLSESTQVPGCFLDTWVPSWLLGLDIILATDTLTYGVEGISQPAAFVANRSGRRGGWGGEGPTCGARLAWSLVWSVGLLSWSVLARPLAGSRSE